MQEASDEFVEAVAAHRTWVPPRLRTDWDGTGYGGDGTIDDLSPQMGETWEVDHTLDDGYPDSVTFVAGTSVPELTTELAGRSYPPPTAPITATAYWSPLRTDSPVYGYARDVAPVTLDVGLVTSAGRQYARVFTGRMVNTAVRGGRAQLSTISATRLKLMRLVRPPAFSSNYSVGLYATWPISYNLASCDVWAGPKIRTSGTAWYVPMHGSAWPMIPSDNVVFDYAESLTGPSFPSWRAYDQRPGDASPTLIDEVPWIRGPYVSAPDVQLTTDYRRALYTQELRFERSAGDAFSQAGHKGRLEMWVKGDVTNVNTTPGGSGTVTRLSSLWMEATGGSNPYVQMGVTPSRNVEVKVFDGTNTRTLTSASTLPTDGAWYFVGCAYDMAADKLWVNLNGTVASSSASMVTTGLPATDDYMSGYPVFLSALPVAEITFTVGAQANVDSYPLWRNDASFAPDATLYPSTTKLSLLAEPEPQEAWVTIVEYAKAELASVRFTETDELQYLPLAWWVRDEQQVVTDAFDTARNAAAFDIDVDPTKIRNSVKVSYTETTALTYDSDYGGYRKIFELSEDVKVTIPPGVTIVRFAYSGIGILPLQYVTMWDNFPPLIGVNQTQITLCDTADGTGIYATSEQVEVGFYAWDATSATLRFNNKTTLTWYLANNGDFSALIITGTTVEQNSTYALDEDPGSIAERGIRALDVSANVLQDETAARRLARNLKTALRRGVPTIGADQQGVEVLANPLRQPGDLVTFHDRETGVDGGQWRLRGVHHKGDGANYRQSVVARQTLPIMIIGQGRVGETLIGPAGD